MIEMSNDFRRGIHAFANIAYNKSAVQVVEHMHPRSHPAYKKEKVTLVAHSLAAYYGRLDADNRERFMQWAFDEAPDLPGQ